MGVPKTPAKIFIFEEILKGTIQLSDEHSIFHLEFMSVYVAAQLFILLRIWDVARNKILPVHRITQDLGCCQEQKAYTFQLLPYKN